ncbi:hypothetical protein RJT34_22896 [Clitoria ternatea]|uniref:Uncharacterized protein n=1 Tax=Clitoria ternatea TaxID=43366 RepID=A0AAN9FJY7_CLITE
MKSGSMSVKSEYNQRLPLKSLSLAMLHYTPSRRDSHAHFHHHDTARKQKKIPGYHNWFSSLTLNAAVSSSFPILTHTSIIAAWYWC